LSIRRPGLASFSSPWYQPSGAQVVRELHVELKVSRIDLCVLHQDINDVYGGQAGTNVIEVTGLSSTTETESFRVDGLGNARLLVVQCTLDRHPEITKSNPIRDLTSQLDELQTEKRAREQEVALLEEFGKSMAEKHNVDPDQAIAFSNKLLNKILSCAETVLELDEMIARLDQKINKLRSSRSGAAFTKAIITILADEDGSAQLRLIYREGKGAKLRVFV
jgi:hypothetical protein